MTEEQRKAKSLRMWADYMQKPDNGDAMQKMARVLFDIDTLRDPEDAISSRMAIAESEEAKSLYSRLLERYEMGLFKSIVQEVADQTGADPAQIANQDTRTAEQQQAMFEAAANRQRIRMNKFLDSDFMKVMQALNEVDTILHDADDLDWIGPIEAFILYYFTTRPDIRPSESGQFTQTDKEELIEQYKRFEAFLISHCGSVEKANAMTPQEGGAAFEAFIAAEHPQKAQEIIESLSSVLPENHVIPNNKLANTMTKDIIDIGKIMLEVQKRGAKKGIHTSCMLTYEGDNVHLSGRQPFTEYDRNVYNAVSSLYVYGDEKHVMTPAMVYRAMTGMKETEKPTAGQLAAVTRSLDKMRFIRTRIDCTAELKARRVTLNSKQMNNGEIDTYLLAAEAVRVRAGGQTVSAYHIIKPPILYEYSAAVNQVLTVPAAMLDIKEIDKTGNLTARSLPNTEARIQIKGYLLRRIEGMKGKNGLSNHVISLCDYVRDGETHQGLYSIAGNPDPTRTEANRIRADAEKMLLFWQARGDIKAFEPVTQGRKITGYKITV